MDVLPIKADLPVGRVYLIGAGPGDPDLLTLKAYRLLQAADVVLYDALVSDEILSLLPAKAEKIAVGKRANKHSVRQTEINQLLITKAYTRLNVVRLKGGDPFIFGRGGEELEALISANIPFEVVPGITAATGAAAYAGFPLTHRDYAQSVSFITGHCKSNADPLDWSQYAQGSETLVIYMGILNAKGISEALIKAGRSGQTPVAIISKASTSEQQTFIGNLANLAQLAAKPELEMPALIVIGDVVKLRDKLNWFSPQTSLETPFVVKNQPAN